MILAVADAARAADNWRRAGFAISEAAENDGVATRRAAAGAVTIELCAPDASAKRADGDQLGAAIAAKLAEGGGIVGWMWGVSGSATVGLETNERYAESLPGVFIGWRELASDRREVAIRRKLLAEGIGTNPNTVAYLDHIVVMTPELDDAIATLGRTGVACRRVRDAGNGMHQAFFKLEETVLEVVGPAHGRPGCWGLAFMCGDIDHAVAGARAAGLQVTQPKVAVQGGRIARIVEPLDGVAIAFMEPPRDAG